MAKTKKTKKKRKNSNHRPEEKYVLPEILELTKKYYTTSPTRRKPNGRGFNAITRLMSKYPGLTVSAMEKLSCELNEIYNRILTEQGFRNSNIGLRNMDTLDMTEISVDEMDELITGKVWQYINALPPDQQIYYLIPCFRKGVIMSNTRNGKNTICAIEYDVKNVDIEKRSMHVIMQSYHGNNACDSPLTVSYSGEYEITLEPIEPERMADADTPIEPTEHWSSIYDANIHTINSLTGADINELLKPEQLCWNSLCYDIWREASINEIRKFEEKVYADGDASIALATNFITSIIVANYFMATHKAKQAEPAIDSKQESDADNKTGDATQPNNNSTTGRVVYHIGKIRTVSKTKPRRVTKTNIRKYRIAEWSRRGHMRRLKSGKLVYIEPSVCHRKKERLGDQTLPFKSPPKTIKIHSQEG